MPASLEVFSHNIMHSLRSRCVGNDPMTNPLISDLDWNPIDRAWATVGTGWDVLFGLDEVRWEIKWTYHFPIATTVRRMELELNVGPPAWVDIDNTHSTLPPPSLRLTKLCQSPWPGSYESSLCGSIFLLVQAPLDPPCRKCERFLGSPGRSRSRTIYTSKRVVCSPISWGWVFLSFFRVIGVISLEFFLPGTHSLYVSPTTAFPAAREGKLR
jgi:hypothetical protein